LHIANFALEGSFLSFKQTFYTHLHIKPSLLIG